MSYILDALKKSEQDQKNRHTPGLDTLHGSQEAVSRSLPTTWIVSTLVLVLANGLFFYWFTRPDSSAETHYSVPLETVSTAPVASENAINTEILRSSKHESNRHEANGFESSRYRSNESGFDELNSAETSSEDAIYERAAAFIFTFA